MAETEPSVLSAVVVGDRTVGENLERAVASGAVVRHPDGRLALAAKAQSYPFIFRSSPQGLPRCGFLNHFMFAHAYARGAVPFGCRACYKVKVVSYSMRQLMAVRALAESLPYSTKSGAEVDNPENPHPYGTYLYLNGLDQARQVYGTLRSKIGDADNLGRSVQMLIKRGCTNYERHCGPSDQYSFDPALEAVEAALAAKFVRPSQPYTSALRNAARILEIVKVAYRIGDETYKDFTGGKAPVLPIVTYEPGP